MSLDDNLREILAAYEGADEQVSLYAFGQLHGSEGRLVLGETSLTVVTAGSGDLYPYSNVATCLARPDSWAFFPIHGANHHLQVANGWQVQGDLIARLSRFHRR